MDIKKYLRREGDAKNNLSREEWARLTDIEDARKIVLTVAEVEDILIRAAGNLEVAFAILREFDIQHVLDDGVIREIPWALFKLKEIRELAEFKIDELEAKGKPDAS